MDALGMRWFSEVARETEAWDAPPRGKGGLSADTIARIVHGERMTIQERTLHLLARALQTSPGLLRLYVEDRSNDHPHEFRTPRAAHHRHVTTRLHRVWEENIRATADALDDAWEEGRQVGYAQALQAMAATHDSGHDPVALAEAMSDAEMRTAG